MMRILQPLVLILLGASLALAQDPGDARWIWAHGATQPRPEDEWVRFRKTFTFEGDVASAQATVSADNHFVLWINGERVGRGDSWERASRFEVTRRLRSGEENLIAVEAWNDESPAGLLMFLDIELTNGERRRIETNASWVTSVGTEDWTLPEFAPGWMPAAEFGRYGEQIWQGITWYVPPPQIETLPGFQVEMIADGMGSVIAMGLGEGDEIVFSEEGGLLQSLRFDERGTPSWTPVTEALKSCMGICWAKGSLWAVGQGPGGWGLYRVDRDSGEVELFGRLEGSGEHGPHAVMEGPDGRLYVMIGNHTKLLEPVADSSPFQISYEGNLLPRYTDPRGHARNIRKPGGLVATVDVETKQWEIFGAGFRNAYDMAFNDRGDLFAFDSDMEWDVALPWYRPIRLNHVLPAAEFGWRTGSSKWPEWYPDSLPAVVDADRGSPTGVAYYGARPTNRTRFPGRFLGSILGADWSSGTILAFRIRPTGMSYDGTVETLVRGKPLNVTDLLSMPDGSVVFSVGGRGTRGAIYRLTYAGPPEPPAVGDPIARPYPMSLFTPQSDPAQLVDALDSDDRAARFLAGRTLERIAPSRWRERALGHDSLRVRAEGLLALARLGLERTDVAACRFLVRQAAAVWAAGPVEDARITSLRVLELLLQDEDAPDRDDLTELAGSLLDAFPTRNRPTDRLLANLLAHLAPSGAAEALVTALEQEPSREEQVQLAYALRVVDRGWTKDSRVRFWYWLERSSRWRGGMSYEGFLSGIRKDAEKQFPADELEMLRASVTAQSDETAPRINAGQSGEPVDYDKTLMFLQRTQTAWRRSAAEGARVYQKAACADCHQYGTIGRGLGPELTTLANRFSMAEMLESLVEPSRQISDQYASVIVVTEDDIPYHGMLAGEDDEKIVLIDSQAKQVEILKSEIQEREASDLSVMPKGLLDGLTMEEIGDLFTFMRSAPLEAIPEQSQWQPLFDGTSLAGWEGSDRWRVENGVLVGKAENLAASDFLVSQAEYGDCVVELDALVTSGGNTGLQFRSEKLPAGQMRGYQADMGQNYWGSLYEQEGRGMLAQGTNEIWRGAVDEAGWNHVLVEAVGDQIRIELNGSTIVTFRDTERARGFLGLQLHGGMNMEARFRNLRVREIQRTD